ncbi:MAG: polyprenyl synthetase family protein [Acidobacteria bacterium]|nr:polyprenyl synthetase family protein [Acidobacteriota bacterium]
MSQSYDTQLADAALTTGTAPGRSAPEPISLPARVPRQRYRRTQSNIPDDAAVRDHLKRAVARHVQQEKVVPPLSLSELRDHALAVIRETGVNAIYGDYLSVLVNNEAWKDDLARIPYEKRLFLVPKCLRVEELCPAPFDEFGLLCKECGLCSLHDLTVEAERLGYAVLVAEGSALVTKMVATGSIEAIVGVSCLNVLEKCFPHMEAAAIPGISIPLLQDDCVNTTVDINWIWDALHLTAADKSYRLDLDALKTTVSSWFDCESLAGIMGEAEGETEEIARAWLARAGKRWRPYLSTCVYMAQQGEGNEVCDAPLDLKKLGVAIECFHKASLIHDDIEDGDAERYQEQSLHMEYGLPVALNVGDFLLGEGYRLIGEIKMAADIKVEMLQTAAAGHVMLSRGQGAELCWARAPRPLSSLDVLQIFRQKTAPAFEVALRLGALYAGVDRDSQAVLKTYSESLGIAYQVRDDLDDFSGESDSHDLRDLRPSLLLAIAHKRAKKGEEKQLLEALWKQERDYDDVADQVQRIFRERSVVEKARDLLAAYEEQAVQSLRPLTSPTLKGLLRRVIGKIFGQPTLEGYCSEFEARNAAGRAAGAKGTG